ncbi:MAG: hypothetical protein LQ351_000290 [Letrouitia transgressa]|nr:MAG: hypothetical protein LQ351_000290 [Letrouitia transgressa]
MLGPSESDKTGQPLDKSFSSDIEYRYDPLPAGGWTRILELYPGTGFIECSLTSEKIVDLSLSFEALSYTWGSDALEKKVGIKCNGCALSIGSNLASALTHIRNEIEPRRLWADAVCINQSDTHERSLQVQHMGDIYANAQRVLIWIGEDCNNEASECFELIEKTSIYLTAKLLQHQSINDIPPIPYDDRSVNLDTQKWDMVRRLTDSEWFDRVWVLQEIGLARSATICYGKSTMAWSQLVELMLFISYRTDLSLAVNNSKASTIWEVFEDIWCSFGNKTTWRNELPLTRSLNKASGHQTLIDILAVTRPYKATDHRDRVYAFISHPAATNGTRRNDRTIVADYSKSLDSVYRDIATHVLETDQNPWTVLSTVDHKPDSPSLTGQRPSWVPRWDEGWYTYWLGYPSMWYRAGGNSTKSFYAEVNETAATLQIQGKIVDVIIWVSRAYAWDELELEHQVLEAPVQNLWQQLEQQGLGTLYGQSSQDSEYAFSLTVAAGRAADDGPAEDNPDLHWSVYQEYKNLLNWSKRSSSEPTAKRPEMRRQMSEKTLELNARTYTRNQLRTLFNRRFFLTSKGYYGIGHRSLEAGDVSAVLIGAHVPFVLRKAPLHNQIGHASDHYRLIGESYIHGIMRGELLGGRDDLPHNQRGIFVEETITLI